MSLAIKTQQIVAQLETRIGFTFQTPPCDININADVLYQAFLAHIVVLGAYETQDEQIHPSTVEILGEGVKDVDFLYDDQNYA